MLPKTSRPLPPELGEKLTKLLPMLGSDQMGEVIATVEAIKRALTAHDRDWHDVTAAVTLPPEVMHLYRDDPRVHQRPGNQDRITKPSEWVHDALDIMFQHPSWKPNMRGEEFLMQTRRRAQHYDTCRFTPKQWAWFEKMAREAGVAF